MDKFERPQVLKQEHELVVFLTSTENGAREKLDIILKKFRSKAETNFENALSKYNENLEKAKKESNIGVAKNIRELALQSFEGEIEKIKKEAEEMKNRLSSLQK